MQAELFDRIFAGDFLGDGDFSGFNETLRLLEIHNIMTYKPCTVNPF
jgi:hypothetical protein